jgi:hypothetical protein
MLSIPLSYIHIQKEIKAVNANFILCIFSTLYYSGKGPGSSVDIANLTGWTVRGSNPDGGEIFRTCPDRP